MEIEVSIDDRIHEVRSRIAKERAYMRRRNSVCMNLSPEADGEFMKGLYDELKRLNRLKKESVTKGT